MILNMTPQIETPNIELLQFLDQINSPDIDMENPTRVIKALYEKEIRENIGYAKALMYLHESSVSMTTYLNLQFKKPSSSGFVQGFYVHADNARKYLKLINQIVNLLNSKTINILNENFAELIKYLQRFLKQGSTTIPNDESSLDLQLLINESPAWLNSKLFEFHNVNIFIKKNNKKFETKVIGSGSYAIVSAFIDEDYNKKIAVKKLKSSTNEKELERFKQEFRIMKDNLHPNILEVFAYDNSDNSYTSEFCEFSLDKFIAKNPTLPLQARKHFSFQIVETLTFLHSKGILHRDLSFNNILIKMVGEFPVIKIADFGLAKYIDESILTSTNTEMKGSLNRRDPLLVQKSFKNYNTVNEISSLGLLLNFVIFGQNDYSDLSPFKNFSDIDENKRPKIEEVWEIIEKIEN